MNVASPPAVETAPAPASPPLKEPRSGLRGLNLFLIAFGFAPLLAAFFVNLWDRPHYQFFPLAIAGALFLAWSRLKEVSRPLEPGSRSLTVLMLSISFLLLVVGAVFWSPWLGGIAAMITLAGVVWWTGGYRLFKSMLPAMLLLLLIIPPPLNADARLVQDLRLIAVAWSSRLLDVLGVTHSLSGNVIELPRQSLLVDEACSGINSVLIMLACALFYGLWRRRPAIHILVCMVSSTAFVLLGNMARITVGAWVKFRFGMDILSGRPHELTGLVLLVTYLVLILSMDQLLVFLTSPVRSRSAPSSAPAEQKQAAAAPRRAPLHFSPFWGQAVGCAFAVLGLLELGRGWSHYHELPAGLAIPKTSLREGATFALPDQIGAWKRLNMEVPPLQRIETRGVYSQIWHYRRGDILASLAIDYPFEGYHDVSVCYTLRGWDLHQQAVHPGTTSNGNSPFAEAQMLNHLGLHGELWFSVVDEHGRWLPGEDRSLSLRNALARFKVAGAREPVTYQVQALVTGFNPLRPQEREQVQQFFQESRVLLWRQLFAQLQTKR